MRGERGGEAPNVYLDDGTVRGVSRATERVALTRAWQKVRIPLAAFSAQGVDLSYLRKLQIEFEWEPMSGTIYVADIGLEGGADAARGRP
jgi:hypothetical protein